MKKFSFKAKNLTSALSVLESIDKSITVFDITINYIDPKKDERRIVIFACNCEHSAGIEEIILNETCMKVEVFSFCDHVVFIDDNSEAFDFTLMDKIK